MTFRMSQMTGLALITLPLLSFGAAAQIAVSSNDNKIINVNGANQIVQNPPADTVTIVDLGASPPRVIGEVKAPSSVAGPPQNVAVAPDESFALVAAAAKIDPADPKKTVPDNKLTVIDLKVSPPAVIATLEAGMGASGVSINVIDLTMSPPRIVDTISVGQIPEGVAISPDGSHVAVTIQNGSQRPKSHQAFNDFGLVKVFRINGTTLTLVAEAKVGHWGQGVVWSRDGKTLLAQSMIEKKLEILSFDGKDLKKTGAIKVNGGPEGLRTAQ